jgi:hypothetical protein
VSAGWAGRSMMDMAMAYGIVASVAAAADDMECQTPRSRIQGTARHAACDERMTKKRMNPEYVL